MRGKVWNHLQSGWLQHQVPTSSSSSPSYEMERRGVLGNEHTQDTFWLLTEEVTQCEWVLCFRLFFSKAGSEMRMWVCLEDDPKKHCQGRRKVREERRKQIERVLTHHHGPTLGTWGSATLGNSGRQYRRHLGVFPPKEQGSLAFSLQVSVPRANSTIPPTCPWFGLRGLPWPAMTLSKELQVLSAEPQESTHRSGHQGVWPGNWQHLPNLQSLPQNTVRPLGYEMPALAARGARFSPDCDKS